MYYCYRDFDYGILADNFDTVLVSELWLVELAGQLTVELAVLNKAVAPLLVANSTTKSTYIHWNELLLQIKM